LTSVRHSSPYLSHIPPTLWLAIMATGIALSVLGILIVTVASFWDASHPIVELISSVAVRSRSAPIWARTANHSDLRALYEFLHKKWDEVPSVEKMTSWQERCDTGFWLFFNGAKRRDLGVNLKLIGAFKILPITQQAVDDLERGLTTGSQFDAEHICLSSERPAAYYVGDLLVTDEHFNAAVLYDLDAKCIEIIKSDLPIYARPFTKKGVKVMEHRGFLTFPENNSNLQINKLSKLDPRFATTSPFELRRSPRKRKSQRQPA